MATSNPIEAYGFTAVPRSLEKQLAHTSPSNNKPLLLEDLPLPHSHEASKQAHQYAKEYLPAETFNHSMRVFLWGKHQPM